jgi:pimeloyl-ACP methyl ester carboxylesterase
MKTEKTTIKNRRGFKLVIQVDLPDNPTNSVFIAHGQRGFKEQKHIQAFADAFLENNFRVVRFDATHSLGESEGEVIDVTYDSYIEDLEDVINWAKTQGWFQEPFALCGHSMGAQSVAWYAEYHPKEVNLLAPIAPVVNYDLYIQTLEPEHKKDWQEVGYDEAESKSRPGVITRVGWQVNESLKKYDLLPNANNLIMPILVIVGEFDSPCPVEHQEIFLKAIPGNNKTLIKVAGVDHNFRTLGGEQKNEIVKDDISNWLKSVK